MNTPYHHDRIFVADRQARLRREADRQRLMSAIRPRRPAVYLRVLGSVGDWMIAGGTRLKARHQAAQDMLRANGYHYRPGLESQ